MCSAVHSIPPKRQQQPLGGGGLVLRGTHSCNADTVEGLCEVWIRYAAREPWLEPSESIPFRV